MKNKLGVFLFVFIFLWSFKGAAQTKSAFDQAADEVCDGLQKLDPNKATNEEVKKAYESLIVKAFSAHMNELMKEMDMASMNGENGRKIGEEIGRRMLTRCPVFITLAAKFEDSSGDVTSETHTTNGTLTKINDTGDFAQFIIKTEDGREVNYYWLRYFKGSENFEKSNSTQIGKKVKIEWAEIECYVPKARGYYKLKEVKSIAFL